jgi:hypothetical protein
MRAAVVLYALLVCGCHESLGLVGDAYLDPSYEPPGDVAVDVVHDSVVDPVADPVTDPHPDAPCPPRSDEEMYISFSLDHDTVTRYNLMLVCILIDTDVHPDGLFILDLECRSDEGLVEDHILTIQTNPVYIPDLPIDLWFDDDLIVHYVADPIFWTNRWLAIHDTRGGLLLAAVDAEYVLPADTTDWYDPLGVWLYSSACPVEEDYCGLIERMALEVEGRDASVIVLDGNVKPLEDRNTYEVMVAQAHRYRFIDCEDVPLTWVQALIYLL